MRFYASSADNSVHGLAFQSKQPYKLHTFGVDNVLGTMVSITTGVKPLEDLQVLPMATVVHVYAFPTVGDQPHL